MIKSVHETLLWREGINVSMIWWIISRISVIHVANVISAVSLEHMTQWVRTQRASSCMMSMSMYYDMFQWVYITQIIMPELILIQTDLSSS